MKKITGTTDCCYNCPHMGSRQIDFPNPPRWELFCIKTKVVLSNDSIVHPSCPLEDYPEKTPLKGDRP